MELMKAFGFIVLLLPPIATGTPAPTPPTPTPTPPPTPPPFYQGPQYTIDCLENGSVTIKGLSPRSSLKVLNVNGQGSSCTPNVAVQIDTSRSYVINTDCLVPETGSERTVTVAVYDPAFDKATKNIPVASTISSLVGGQNGHNITIKCTGLPDRGMNVKVVHGIKVETATVSRPKAIEQVAMYLKADRFTTRNNVTELPDISSVYIGDKFYMYIVYLGTQDYSVIPQKCSAFAKAYASEPLSSEKHIDLWTAASCLTGDVKNYRIMHMFKKGSKGNTVLAEMYGFHFQGEGEITFACDVLVCRTGASNCNLPTNDDCTNSEWETRRKRNAPSMSESHFEVSKSIKVLNRDVGNTAAVPSSAYFYIFTSLFLILRAC